MNLVKEKVAKSTLVHMQVDNKSYINLYIPILFIVKASR